MPSKDRSTRRPAPEGKSERHVTEGWKPPKATNPPRPIKPPSGSGGTPKSK